MTKETVSNNRSTLPKTPTGISGLDEITDGGLPKGRPTLVCGGPGCGKTLFGLEFLARGALQFDEPGVCMAFEETAEELAKNVSSLGFNLNDLIKKKKLLIDFVRVERTEIQETGDYDLEGLFVRLGHAIDSIGAKRVLLDTIEVLFAGLSNEGIVRAELRRLFRWLKEKGVTTVITGERGNGSLTRHGLEEYVSDCVIVLDHRVDDQISTRRLRVVKYRGSTHGTNEYPFVIREDGISVIPITSLGLRHKASKERIPTGINRLDTMLGGEGYFRGSSILVSGTAGTGKTTIAAQFADACCARGERCLYLAFEESEGQFLRNMESIGLNLQQWVDKGLLDFIASRPTLYGLEMHLASIHDFVETFDPGVVILDPITNFAASRYSAESKLMLMRLIDYLKLHQITTMFTSLTIGEPQDRSELGISSLMDSWLVLKELEHSGERNRVLYIYKSRGMAHSNQVREFRMTDHGIELSDVYVGTSGVLTGSARLAQEATETAASLRVKEEIESKKRQLERKKRIFESEKIVRQAQFESEEEELKRLIVQDESHMATRENDRLEMAVQRQADSPPPA